MRFANRLFSSEWRRFLSRDVSSYTQGQSPEARIRQYFYYIDHQGQLFLDDTKVKNFVTCFKGISGVLKHLPNYKLRCKIYILIIIILTNIIFLYQY
uniref:Si:ch1073-287p18.1 n=1 Tax=Sinocyclocheilus grahami TaxID=75366 RepID=A0A672RBZ5_SINGR